MTRRRLFLAAVAPSLAAVGAAALATLPRIDPPWLLVNESPSVARGVYLRRADLQPSRGRLVAAPQPDGPAGRYLADLGVPRDVRLLKRVSAVGGETVCAAAGALAVPGRTVPVPHVDRRGRALPAWTGCRRLAADELLLLGDTASSFDSRHFGPVRRPSVQGVYVEILTW